MKRPQVLGLIVLVCLSAPRVNAAEAKKKNSEAQQQQTEEQRRAAEEAAQRAEELRKQAEAAEAEARRLSEAQREATEQQTQAEQKLAEVEQAQKKQAGPEPKLNIPIRYFVYTALLSGLGYATGIFSRGPVKDLRNPAKHPTQDKTLSLYRRAYYGGLVSKGFYSLSGTMGAFAAYKTQSAVREYFTAKAQAQMAARQQDADQRLAQAQSPEQRKAAEVTNALLVPPEPADTELPVAALEPPPLQAGFFVGPSGEGSLSLSLSF